MFASWKHTPRPYPLSPNPQPPAPPLFLYILRHAWAGEFGDPTWPEDSLRPLTSDGAKRFRQVAKLYAERGVDPGVIATSPYVRCRQTAEILAGALVPHPRLTEFNALAPGSDLSELIEWTNRHAGQDVCWVGHRPDVGRLAAQLLGHGDAHIRFAKGSMAAIRFDGPVAPSTGQLYWLTTAKMLGE
jgi:phosphohistidine phosphatase